MFENKNDALDLKSKQTNRRDQDLVETLRREMLDLERNRFQDKNIHIYKAIIQDILNRSQSSNWLVYDVFY